LVVAYSNFLPSVFISIPTINRPSFLCSFHATKPFEIYFADKDESIDLSANYEKLIKKSIQIYSRGGYIDYKGSYGLSRDIGSIIYMGLDFLKRKNYLHAFAVAKPTLKLTMEAATYADDSSGNIGGLLQDIIELIRGIVESTDAAIELKEQVYAFLQVEMNNKIYFDYGDFGYDLFPLIGTLAAQLNKQTEYIQLIDKLLALSTREYERYSREFFQKQKITFYEASGNIEQAEKLIRENINIVEVRKGLVNKAIAQKDFVTAKKLINDGIKVAESNHHPGTVAEWEKALLQVAAREKDTPSIRNYSKKLAFDNWFNTEYYNQWKKTFTADEWPAVIEAHIAETTEKVIREHGKNNNRLWRSSGPPLLKNLASIYIEENYWDRMLALIKKETYLEDVWEYHPYLSKPYPAELIEIYIPLFTRAADNANSRSHYAELAAKMKKVIKDIPSGKEKITALARNLQLKYPRRPAMVQELNSVLK
jgi:hypothetical protein